jgi:apolipoprotein N-acyltransferase
MGAEVLVNITNDLWYGDTAAPRQHLEIAAFRSVETRRFLLRSTNSGYSALIDPWGRVPRRSELFQEEFLAVEASFLSGKTIFVRLGDLPVLFLIVASAIFLFWELRRQA